MDDNKYLETLNFVVNFLHEEGFHKAHAQLLQEFGKRLSNDPGSDGVARQSTSAASAPPSTADYGERAGADLSPPRSKSAQDAGPSWEGFTPALPKATSTAGAVESAVLPGPATSPPAGVSPPASATARTSRRRSSRPAVPRQRSTWDGDVDEYEGMDDPGYCRREVPSQQRFAETELDVGSEDGSERAYFMHQPGDLNYDDIESEVSASDPEGIAPASSGQHSSYPSDTHDESWDFGPTDIKFAEPVSTPSKSPEKQDPGERRPVLSRVESLSSSFKDFEMERGNNADADEGQASFKLSEAEYAAVPEVIDFPVAAVVDHEDVELFRQKAHHSPTSSLDVAAGSRAPSTIMSEQTGGESSTAASSKERGGRRKGGVAKGPSLLKALATGRSGDVRENGGGGGGGFSFPITPPSDEPDQRLFTSWPSVRSSCTSEPIAIDDDDNALPAEYADDEYSKYRLTSRSTSLAAQDFPPERKQDGEHALGSQAPPSPDGGQSSSGRGATVPDAAEEEQWEFKPPMDRQFSHSREPSLEFSTPNTDDEGPDTPTASGTPAGGSVVGGNGGSPTRTLSAAQSQKTREGSRTGEGVAGEQGEQEPVPEVELRPLVPPGASDESPPKAQPRPSAAAGPSALSLCMEPMDRKASAQVKAHRINFELDDLREHSHDGLEAAAAAAAAAASARSGSTDGLTLTSEHLQQQEEQQQQQRHCAGEQEAASGSRARVGSDSVGLGTASLVGEGDFDADLLGGGGHGDGDEVDEGLTGLEAELGEKLLIDDGEEEMEDAREDVEGEEEQGGERDGDVDVERMESGGLLATDEEEEEAGRSQAGEAEESNRSRADSALNPRYHVDEQGNMLYDYEPEYIEKKYEVFELRIIHRRHRTGFEETKDFPIRLNDLIAGRYQVMDFLGSAAFSRAVQALDVKTGQLVCLKIIKNNKDYFDQSLDEIKLLKYVNSMDPNDEYAVVRLYDFFYYKEHLFLVCELLRANLYEFQKYNKESGEAPYFTNARIQRIARQALRSLAFLHSLGLIHSDLKPENILIKSYSRCEVKVIDLGSSCFITDQLSSYVQSRSYRAPEVILGLPYDYKVDVWSLGCILAELSSGFVLFQNDSLATLLARLEGILGPIPEWMLHRGRYAHRFYTRSGMLYERASSNQRYELLLPKRTTLRHRMPDADEGLMEFVSYLLTVDPRKRPTAAEALKHPWLQMEYPSLDA